MPYNIVPLTSHPVCSLCFLHIMQKFALERLYLTLLFQNVRLACAAVCFMARSNCSVTHTAIKIVLTVDALYLEEGRTICTRHCPIRLETLIRLYLVLPSYPLSSHFSSSMTVMFGYQFHSDIILVMFRRWHL